MATIALDTRVASALPVPCYTYRVAVMRRSPWGRRVEDLTNWEVLSTMVARRIICDTMSSTQ